MKHLARKTGIVAAAAIALVFAGAQPSFGWGSSVTYSAPAGCSGGSLSGSSWYPSGTETRASSGVGGDCGVYVVIYGHRPTLSAALRYTTGGSTAGASTTGTYVSTTAWNNYTNYLGGVHRWDSVTLNT